MNNDKDKKKEIEVIIAPGAFNNFDGTQEELDQFVETIRNMFKNKTAEEIMEMGRPLTEEEIVELNLNLEDISLEKDYKNKLN
jgi:hypothetical protein